MKTFAEVRMLHIEISSRCNARCPGCIRNFKGFPYNGGYVERDMSLGEFQNLLSQEFLSQIEEIWFNGNYGDFVMNPDGPEMVEYVIKSNPGIVINISTNGSARDREYWTRLGKTGVKVWFCLDGLEDTHSLYRQDTNFDNILKNAAILREAGGKPSWQYTVFDHNKHQIDSARQLSIQLGFSEFATRPNNRGSIPVFDRQGRKIFNIGQVNPVKFPEKIDEDFVKNNFQNLEIISSSKSINCESVNLKSLYISSTGEISPCCYLKLPNPAPTTGLVVRDDNQLIDILDQDLNITKNRLYFPKIQQSWQSKPHNVCKFFCGK